jgi:hypothetical protein
MPSFAASAEQVNYAGHPDALALQGEGLSAANRIRSLAVMPSSRRSPSPEVTALRAAAEGSCRQLRDQVREQARLIRSGAVGELTEADVERMAEDITAAARARLDAAAPPRQSPSADPELQATRRQAGMLMAAAAREADAVLRKAWQARHEKAAGRRWRR